MTDVVPPRKSRLRRWTIRLLRIGISVYLVCCIVLYFAQDWIAFPGSYEQGTDGTRIRYGGDASIVHMTTRSGIPITAVFGLARQPDGAVYPDPNDRPTILYFYGNGSSAASSEGEFDHFRMAGCNVLIPDLAGYGMSGGKASETTFYATADAAWDYLQSRSDVDMKRIVSVGWSMGAAVAVDLASRRPVIGLATFNAYTDLPTMAHRIVPAFPTGWLLKYRFDNLSKVQKIHCPLFICNGQLDTLVPPAMSDQLTAHAASPVTRLVLSTADHNTIFTAEPATLWPMFDRWIESLHQP